MKTQLSTVCITAILFLTVTATFAADWPQYRGPNQDGISTETLNPVLPTGGPKLLWKVPISGYGSFAISGDRVFAMSSRANKGEMRELCVALDSATGKELWAADITSVKYVLAADSYGEKSGDGPRTTPTVNDGKVYVYSTDAKLCCFDAKTGKELWRVDVQKDHGGAERIPPWGNSSSPVVDGDLVFVAGGGPGESILAINKNSGQVVWKKGDAPFDFNTPLVATIHGERQVLFCLGHKLVSVSVKDGQTLWRKGLAWHEANAWSSQPLPIVSEDRVWYGSALDACTLFQIVKYEGGFYGKWIWDMNNSNENLPYTTPVLRDGHFYGTFGRTPDGKKAELQFKCLVVSSDRTVKWAQKGFGSNNSVILVGDALVILSDSGEIVVVEAKPDAYKELRRFKAVDGKCYAAPAFSNGRLYIRSTQESACYDVSAK